MKTWNKKISRQLAAITKKTAKVGVDTGSILFCYQPVESEEVREALAKEKQ